MSYYIPKNAGVTLYQEVLRDVETRATLTAAQTALNNFGDPVYLEFLIINREPTLLYVRPVADLAEPVAVDNTYMTIAGESEFYWRRRDDEVALDFFTEESKADVWIIALVPAEL